MPLLGVVFECTERREGVGRGPCVGNGGGGGDCRPECVVDVKEASEYFRKRDVERGEG